MIKLNNQQTINNLNKKTRESFLKLKKLKLIFKNSSEAANFLNKNKSRFYHNWQNVIKNESYLNLRKIILK